MNSPVFIYGLFHRDRCVYVGQSVRPTKRFQEHKSRFVSELGEAPELKILKEIRNGNGYRSEKNTILAYRKQGQADFNQSPMPKKNSIHVNLSIRADIALAIKLFAIEQRTTVSELTENLWISFMRKQGVKLPPLFKNGRSPRGRRLKSRSVTSVGEA